MDGEWSVGLGEDGFPHLHFTAPFEEDIYATGISPNALSFLLYLAAASVAKYLALDEPAAPFAVWVDPTPKFSPTGDKLYGCIVLEPWGEPLQQARAATPAVLQHYTEVLQGFAGQFNTAPECAELRSLPHIEPLAHVQGSNALN